MNHLVKQISPLIRRWSGSDHDSSLCEACYKRGGGWEHLRLDQQSLYSRPFETFWDNRLLNSLEENEDRRRPRPSSPPAWRKAPWRQDYFGSCWWSSPQHTWHRPRPSEYSTFLYLLWQGTKLHRVQLFIVCDGKASEILLIESHRLRFKPGTYIRPGERLITFRVCVTSNIQKEKI